MLQMHQDIFMNLLSGYKKISRSPWRRFIVNYFLPKSWQNALTNASTPTFLSTESLYSFASCFCETSAGHSFGKFATWVLKKLFPALESFLTSNTLRTTQAAIAAFPEGNHYLDVILAHQKNITTSTINDIASLVNEVKNPSAARALARMLFQLKEVSSLVTLVRRAKDSNPEKFSENVKLLVENDVLSVAGLFAINIPNFDLQQNSAFYSTMSSWTLAEILIFSNHCKELRKASREALPALTKAVLIMANIAAIKTDMIHFILSCQWPQDTALNFSLIMQNLSRNSSIPSVDEAYKQVVLLELNEIMRVFLLDHFKAQCAPLEKNPSDRREFIKSFPDKNEKVRLGCVNALNAYAEVGRVIELAGLEDTLTAKNVIASFIENELPNLLIGKMHNKKGSIVQFQDFIRDYAREVDSSYSYYSDEIEVKKEDTKKDTMENASEYSYYTEDEEEVRSPALNH